MGTSPVYLLIVCSVVNRPVSELAKVTRFCCILTMAGLNAAGLSRRPCFKRMQKLSTTPKHQISLGKLSGTEMWLHSGCITPTMSLLLRACLHSDCPLPALSAGLSCRPCFKRMQMLSTTLKHQLSLGKFSDVRVWLHSGCRTLTMSLVLIACLQSACLLPSATFERCWTFLRGVDCPVSGAWLCVWRRVITAGKVSSSRLRNFDFEFCRNLQKHRTTNNLMHIYILGLQID